MKLEKFVLSNINDPNIDVNEYVSREVCLQKKYEGYCYAQIEIEELGEDKS